MGNPKYAPQARYAAENCKQIALKLNRNTDKDILRQLDQTANVNGYIKSLIRADLEKRAQSNAET